MDERREAIRWGVVGSCWLAGATLLALALYVEDRWGWTGVVPAILVNAATAIGLAGVLFLLERQFVGAVGRVSQEAANRAAGAVERRLGERAAALETRLDELQEATKQRVQAAEAEQDQVLANLENVSFGTVTRALATANILKALLGGIARVHASDDPRGLKLECAWGREALEDGWEERRWGPPTLSITVVPGHEMDEELARSVVEVEWRPDQSPADVGKELVEAVRRVGLWQGPQTLQWAVAVRNLRRTIEVAVASRRRDGGAWWLKGAVYELVGDEWAITEGGLESPPHDFLLPQSEFPDVDAAMRRPRVQLAELAFRPPRPCEWVSQRDWDYLVGEGAKLFPRRSLHFLGSPSWIPETDVAA